MFGVTVGEVASWEPAFELDGAGPLASAVLNAAHFGCARRLREENRRKIGGLREIWPRMLPML